MKPYVSDPVLQPATLPDALRSLRSLEAVCLELIRERDRAVAELARLQQPSLFAGNAA